MKKIIFEDEEGFKHRKIIKDNDPPNMSKYGIPDGPPDLKQLDMAHILKEINNNLVANELFTWDDVQRFSGGINVAVNIFRRAIVDLYRIENRDKKERS